MTALLPTHPPHWSDTGMTLFDLFPPAADLMADARIALDRPAPGGRIEGLLPDCTHAGAWALLQARWLGLTTVAFHESAYGGTQGPPCVRHAAIACDLHLPAGEWLAAFDRARRAASLLAADAPLPDSLWCTGLAAPASDATLRLGLMHNVHDDDAPRLWLRAPAGCIGTDYAARLLDALARTAAELHAHPHTPLGEIGTLPPQERQCQLAQWNRPARPYERALTVPGLFARRATEHPDALALIDGDERLSYRALARRAEHIAQRLQAHGVQAGDTVGLLADRGAAAVAAMLGILQAGAAYLPVPPDFPAARIAFMLADAGARWVALSSRHQTQVPAGLEVLTIDGDGESDGTGGSGMPPLRPAAIDGEALAYVMYTSGSTGQPKGIEICHRAILRLAAAPDYMTLRPGEAMLHAAPLGFDAATLEVWGPLLNGGCCVVHGEAMPTGAGLARTIGQHQVRSAWLTAALFNAVVDEDPSHLRGLRELLVGGEALSVAHVRRALAALPQTTLINGYGPTECTTFSATHRIGRTLPADARSVPIGRPINDTTLYVLSPTLALLPTGFVGELCIGGRGLARGYLGQPDLTAERFVPDPFGAPGERIYRSGDRVRWLADGTLEYIGRADAQIKIGGHRIEPGEVEAALMAHGGIRACAVVARRDGTRPPRLIAYLVPKAGEVPWPELRAHLAARLPAPMQPAAAVWLARLPITANGKLDRDALPTPARTRPPLAQPWAEPQGPLEAQVCAAFGQVLEVDPVGRNDSFFDLGGDSLRVLHVLAMLQAHSPQRLTPNLLFAHPTPAAIARALMAAPAAPYSRTQNSVPSELPTAPAASTAPAQAATHGSGDAGEPIALIAMAGRFPGAADVEQFWENLVAGREGIRFFDDAALDAGVSAALRADPDYVRARGVLDGIEDFDAAFFGIPPKEAELMDPQQRVFLEICWEALERAGYAPRQCPVPVGVYGGMGNATYFQRHLSTRPALIEAVGEFQVMLGNEKDYMATRVAHRLNLTGPAVSLNTACSTSLVAVHEAFHALRGGQCGMALAGGVSITCPPHSGYLYQEGAMLSPDGHTRSFDAKAQGTVFCDGAAVVLLKRLGDALADGDPIHAVLLGAAVNNDGGAKASFTAPSAAGQAAVIGAALGNAGVDARSLSYVETHGTATPMGDPIEVEGLARAFAAHTRDTGFCRIGSVKSNVGHLVMAAGATGLIKTALALRHEQLPATLHFEAPNPSIDFAATPFLVNDRLTPWARTEAPRRAGVSSFGVGGTNAHVIVEEAPLRAPSDPASGPQALLLSARTSTALASACARLAGHLEAHPDLSLADAAHTLRVGRMPFAHRAGVVAETPGQASAALRAADSPWRTSACVPAWAAQPVFMFPGQGAQYAGMGRSLYASDHAFRSAFDECLRAFEEVIAFDLRECMFSDEPAALAPTSATQPATFVLEYALAQRLRALGVQPAALVGHSVGEFAAAVLAGVMRLPDAARLVARRGALMQALPAGRMLSVRLPAPELLARLPADVSLAADNGPCACVAAGPAPAIEALRAMLEAEGVAAKPLQTSHAFHSAMMDPAIAPFEALVRQVPLRAPALPIYSTLSGRLLDAGEATDPGYWARHLRETVRFSPAIHAILDTLAHPLFIEIGPRNTLTTLVRQHAHPERPAPAGALLADTPAEEEAALRLGAVRLWTQGLEIDFGAFDTRARKHRLCLPTTAFERKRLWVDIAACEPAPAAASASTSLPSPALPPEQDMTTDPASANDRRAPLIARLRTLFEDISGSDLAQAGDDLPFVEMGLDSLTLTQAALQVKKAFQVNLSFRQLMESYRSFGALGAFLDANLPPEPAAVAPQPRAQGSAAPAETAIAPTPAALATPTVLAGAPAHAVQQLIAQQMQLMQQQLALLSGAPAAAMALPASTANTVEAATETPGPLRYDVKKAFGAIARIHTQSKEPTERQKARLAAFIRRYVERTRQSWDYTAAHRPHMADPRVVNGFRPITKEITYQIVVDRSQGAHLWDLDGNEYVDALCGFGMNLFGWRPDFINDAVRAQLERGYEIGPQHPLSGEVTQALCELTGFDRAALCNTGSEAVMAAIRIARTVTGRSTVVLFTGSYHGTFDEVLVRAGRAAQGLPAAPGIMAGMFGDVRVLDYGTPETLEFIRAHAGELAAVLVEPVQSRRPDFQPREFIRELRAITERAGTCLIFDEVITGFRAHLGGAQALFGVRADLASYGKVIGGGFPIGVIAGRRAYMDALDGGAWQYGDGSMPTVGVTYFAGTFVRHPLALAACKASLAHLKESGEGLQTQLNLHTAAMADELTAFCREAGAPIEIRHFASLWRITWLEDHPLQDLLFPMMRSRGVHILDNFPCFMSTAHTQQDIARIKSAFKESVAEMQEAEFLPRRTAPATGLDPAHPPIPGARLGRDADGQPAWFAPDPDAQGQFIKVNPA